MSDAGLALVALAIAVGIVGVVVPVLPGALLVWAAVLAWALVERDTGGWVVLGVATLVIGVTQVVKYVLPARRLDRAGVPRAAMLVGLGLAVVGFFVVPVVGALVGFPLGVYLAERIRLRRHAPAWASTRAAMWSVGLSIAIELTGALAAAAAWAAAVAER